MRIFRPRLNDVLVLVIISLGVAIRLLQLDIPFQPEDVHLDYLAGHHVVKYGEVPFSGSGNPILIDSPLYYYIVSFFVFLKDDLLFLAIANIVVIQVATFIFLYLLAVTLFNRRVGFLTVLLAVTSYEYLAEGAYFFQTHVMQVFANGALFFLALAYTRKRLRYAYISIIFFVTAMTIHHSVLALVPVYTVLIFVALPRSINKSKTFGLMVAVGAGVLFIFHLPVMLLFIQSPSTITRIIYTVSTGHIGSISEFIGKFFYNSAQLVYSFSLRWVDHSMMVNIVCGVLLAWSFIRYIQAHQKQRQRTWYVLALLLMMMQLIVVASLLRAGVWHFTFSSVFGLFLIILSVCIVQWFSGSWWHKTIGSVLVLITLYTVSNGFIFLRSGDYPRLHRWLLTLESKEAIKQVAISLKNEESRLDFSFFRIQRIHNKPISGFYVDVYSQQHIQMIEDLLYWPMLEDELGSRFVRMERDGSFPTLLNDDEYIFVICDSTRAPFRNVDDCLHRYVTDYPNYRFVRHVYAGYPISIELVRRINDL